VLPAQWCDHGDVQIQLPLEGVRSCTCSCSENQVVKLVLAHNPAQFQESKERNEGTKHDQTAREQVVEAHLAECSSQSFSVQQSFNRLLNNVKGEYQQAKQKRLMNS
jgi:hypothetical protein